MYESLPAKTISLENLADRLDDVHDGWDNYYHEPPIMQEILQFCRKSDDITKEVVPKLVKVIIRCRIGRGLSYRGGVSPGGVPLFDRFLGMMDDNGIVYCVLSLFHPTLTPNLIMPPARSTWPLYLTSSDLSRFRTVLRKYWTFCSTIYPRLNWQTETLNSEICRHR